MNYAVIIGLGIAGVFLLTLPCGFVFMRLMNRRISAYQNDLAEKHYEEVENMYRQMRGWRRV